MGDESAATETVGPAGIQARVLNTAGRAWLWLECVALFFVLPGAIALGWIQTARILPLLGGITSVVCVWLLFDRGYRFQSDFRWPGRDALIGLLPRMGLVSTGILLLAWLGDAFGVWRPWFGERAPPGDGLFLRLLLDRPGLFLAILVFYPLWSALPQEILYRSFFFRRYGTILGRGVWLVGVNAAAFGFMHVVFLNWLAPVFTLPGGALIAVTYLRSRSVLLATLEHTVYGYAVWLSGLGWFFFFGWNQV